MFDYNDNPFGFKDNSSEGSISDEEEKTKNKEHDKDTESQQKIKLIDDEDDDSDDDDDEMDITGNSSSSLQENKTAKTVEKEEEGEIAYLREEANKPRTNILNHEETLDVLRQQRNSLTKFKMKKELKKNNWKNIPDNCAFNPKTSKFEKVDSRFDKLLMREIKDLNEKDTHQCNNLSTNALKMIKLNPTQAKSIIQNETISKMPVNSRAEELGINSNLTMKQIHNKNSFMTDSALNTLKNSLIYGNNNTLRKYSNDKPTETKPYYNDNRKQIRDNRYTNKSYHKEQPRSHKKSYSSDSSDRSHNYKKKNEHKERSRSKQANDYNRNYYSKRKDKYNDKNKKISSRYSVHNQKNKTMNRQNKANTTMNSKANDHNFSPHKTMTLANKIKDNNDKVSKPDTVPLLQQKPKSSLNSLLEMCSGNEKKYQEQAHKNILNSTNTVDCNSNVNYTQTSDSSSLSTTINNNHSPNVISPSNPIQKLRPNPFDSLALNSSNNNHKPIHPINQAKTQSYKPPPRTINKFNLLQEKTIINQFLTELSKKRNKNLENVYTICSFIQQNKQFSVESISHLINDKNRGIQLNGFFLFMVLYHKLLSFAKHNNNLLAIDLNNGNNTDEWDISVLKETLSMNNMVKVPLNKKIIQKTTSKIDLLRRKNSGKKIDSQSLWKGLKRDVQYTKIVMKMKEYKENRKQDEIIRILLTDDQIQLLKEDRNKSIVVYKTVHLNLLMYYDQSTSMFNVRKEYLNILETNGKESKEKEVIDLEDEGGDNEEDYDKEEDDNEGESESDEEDCNSEVKAAVEMEMIEMKPEQNNYKMEEEELINIISSDESSKMISHFEDSSDKEDN